MNIGFILSVALHIVVLLTLTLEIYSNKKRDFDIQQSIKLDLVAIAETDNIKTTKQKAKLDIQNQQKAEKFYKEKEVEQKSAVKSKLRDDRVVEAANATPPPPVKPKPKVEDKPKVEPKKQPQDESKAAPVPPKPKKVVQKPKPVDDGPKKPKEVKRVVSKVDTFAKTVMQTLETSTSLERKVQTSKSEVLGDTNRRVNEDKSLSVSEATYIRSKMAQNWNTTSFNNAEQFDMYVDLLLKLDEDGYVQDVKVVDSRGSNLSHYDLFLESALTAVWRASPLDKLDNGHYHIWKEMIISFSPKGMIY